MKTNSGKLFCDKEWAVVTLLGNGLRLTADFLANKMLLAPISTSLSQTQSASSERCHNACMRLVLG